MIKSKAVALILMLLGFAGSIMSVYLLAAGLGVGTIPVFSNLFFFSVLSLLSHRYEWPKNPKTMVAILSFGPAIVIAAVVTLLPFFHVSI